MASFSKLLPQDTVPKWQVALIASVPVALGLGYLYYKYNSNTEKILSVKKVSKNADASETIDRPAKPVELTVSQQAELLKNEGNVHFKAGDYEMAVQCYTKAIEICTDDDKTQKATFFQNRAAAYERLNNVENVIKDCASALNLNRRYTKAMVRRAKAAEKVNDIDLALEDFATACMSEGFQNSENISELDRISKASATRDVEEYLKKHVPKLPSRFFIKTYLSTYQHGSALDKVDVTDEVAAKLLEECKSIEQTLLSCENIEGLCSDLIQKCEEARQEIIKTETLLLRATYYILSKQNEKAFTDLEKIIDDENADARVRVNALIKRGTLHQHQGEVNKRDEDFKKAIEIDENNPDIYHHLGQIYLILENTSESVNNFRKAVALNPDFPVTVVQHCYAEYRLASNERNAENMFHFLLEFKKISQKFPDNIDCITLHAQVLTERQEYSEAEKLFNEAIRREPKHAALLVHKALLTLQSKADVEAAKILINKALECDSDCEFAYETIATIEMQLGNLSKSIEYFNEAIKRFTSAEELYHLFSLRNTSMAQMKAEKRIGFAGF